MDIAAMSTILSQGKVMQQASISVMKMAMDAGEAKMSDMVQIMERNTHAMEQSVNHNIGRNIDISL